MSKIISLEDRRKKVQWTPPPQVTITVGSADRVEMSLETKSSLHAMMLEGLARLERIPRSKESQELRAKREELQIKNREIL
jgi:ABC-type Fe2+-enterobactin transport system substrate-binding protein